MEFYNNDPNADGLTKVKVQLDDVKNVMVENIEKVLKPRKDSSAPRRTDPVLRGTLAARARREQRAAASSGARSEIPSHPIPV